MLYRERFPRDAVDLYLFHIARLGFESLQLGLFESDSHKQLALFILWKKKPRKSGYFQWLLMLVGAVSLPAEKESSCGLESFSLRGKGGLSEVSCETVL